MYEPKRREHHAERSSACAILAAAGKKWPTEAVGYWTALRLISLSYNHLRAFSATRAGRPMACEIVAEERYHRSPHPMTTNKLRRLLYSTGAIGVLGVLVSASALGRVVEATARGDRAIEVGTPAISAGGGPLTPDARPALVDFERANDETSRATLLLGLSATLTPLLIFLNVLGFAGSTENEPTHDRARRDYREEPEEGDGSASNHQVTLARLSRGGRESTGS